MDIFHPSAIPPQKIGLYGGSFDPIHNGHLILARDAREQLSLDRVIFLPAAVSPHKLDRPPAPADARCAMVAAAIADEDGFVMDDCEVRRDGPSFAIDTVRHFREIFPCAELTYFIGDDNLSELHTWKDIALLRQLVRFVVFSRDGVTGTGEYSFVTRRIEISSTEIRNRIAAGQSVRYMCTSPVRQVIKMQRLYTND